ncbi:MAG: 4Fe-4S dicluster domain-containing protein [Chloroflexi bacterium]|nr:4Fe-4S dicluster domain-containing protein [Chloroflexota bacterium]MBL7062065.1 4Fe-4S dicluster domain-containing protein [Dehalococcoidia bacterium]
MEAFREIFWNIAFGSLVLYTLGAAALGIFIYAIYRRFRLWAVGKPDKRWDNLGKRIWDFVVVGIVDGLFHRRFFREPYPGIIHFLIFAGAGVLLVGTALDVIDHYVFHFISGNVYLGLSFALDMGGVMMLVGVVMAVIRRYIQKPERLNTVLDNAVVLALIFVVVITGFFIEGFRMLIATPEGLSQPEFYSHPEWARWSFVGYFTASFFAGLSESARLAWYIGLWWFHAALAFGAIFYVCFSFDKLTHIIVSPVNVFFKSSRPKGALAPINIEEAETFGVSKIEDFTWKQLLDLDACTDCGRCQDRCPAYLTGKPLSPRKVMQDLKAHLLDRSHALLAAKVATPTDGGGVKSLIGEVILEDELWSCTTCRACQEICPVFVEHIDKIVDMRRNLVLEQAKVPETGEAVLRCIETRGHSCRGTTLTRTDWTSGLDIKLLSEDRDVDLLYYVGCAAALEDRSMKVAVAVGKVLKAAGVKFAILGPEETCCGEPARRLGNEYLFQMQAMKNIELFRNYNIKRIVTTCPHCFNTIKNEYPQFGGEFEVVHHTQFIAELLKQGKIKPTSISDGRLTYHDSCYLGRHNDIYEAPRQVLANISPSRLLEMKRIRRDGFCCGAGGGCYWMEERIGKRISEERIEQVIETKADIVITACPYCLQMFEDAIKAKAVEESLKALDVAELLAAQLDKGSTG